MWSIRARRRFEAAQREMLEETGYRGARWTPLGTVHPNPAFMSNECSTFLAEGLEWVESPRGDGDEEIEVEVRPARQHPHASYATAGSPTPS